jgi:hypothetical protein
MAPSAKAKSSGKAGIDFSRTNYTVLGIGLFLIIVGFIFLGTGDITISPILLVLGYCVAIPLGILLPGRKKKSESLPGGTGAADRSG